VRSYLTSAGTTCYSAYAAATAGTITAIPAVPSVNNNGPKCAGTVITFSSTVPNGATGLDWAGQVASPGSGTNVFTKNSSNSTVGNYAAKVRSYLTSAGTTCFSGLSASAGTASTINALPTISKHPTTPILKCDYSLDLTLSVSAAAGSGNISKYEWKRNGVTVGTNSMTYAATITEGGTYTVVVTNSNNCSTTSNASVVQVAGAMVGKIGNAACSATDKPGEIGISWSGAGTPGEIGYDLACLSSKDPGTIGN
jgi:hypothetical protein